MLVRLFFRCADEAERVLTGPAETFLNDASVRLLMNPIEWSRSDGVDVSPLQKLPTNTSTF